MEQIMAKPRVDYSLTQAQVHAALDYERATGAFTWKRRETYTASSNSRLTGRSAGTLGAGNYVYICIDGAKFLAHRLAWFWMTGAWPRATVDHIDGCRGNNAWVNLREATESENKRNMRVSKLSASGFRGVYLNKKVHRWAVNIRCDGKNHALGMYPTFELACLARIEGEAKFHGEFAASERPSHTATTPPVGAHTRHINTDLTAAQLRATLDYNRKTGIFRWRQRTGVSPQMNRRMVGTVASFVDDRASGQTKIAVNGKRYFPHRLAWLHVTGQWPLHDIEFIDGNPRNIAFENLRDSTNRDVLLPARVQATKRATRLKGARWHKRTDRWQASICVNGKSRYLGLFDTADQAHAAYREALQIKRARPAPIAS
jgi:hypothetical protein